MSKYFSFFKRHKRLILFISFSLIATNEILLQIFKQNYFPFWYFVFITSLLFFATVANSFDITLPNIKMKNEKNGLLNILVLVGMFESLLYAIFTLTFKNYLSWYHFIPWGFTIFILFIYSVFLFFKCAYFKKFEKKEFLLIGILTIIALGLRFYNLSNYPSYYDNSEGYLLNQGLQSISAHFNPLTWFSTSWPIASNYIFGFILQFSKSFFVLRLPSALIGTLIIPLNYFLIRNIFPKKIAFVSSFLLAFLTIDVHFSRIIIPFIFDQVLGLICFFCLAFAIIKKSWPPALVAGLILGLGQYFYIASRQLIFVFIAVYIIVLIVSFLKKKNFYSHFKIFMSILIGFLIAFTPTLSWYFKIFTTLGQGSVPQGMSLAVIHNFDTILNAFQNSLFSLNLLHDLRPENFFGHTLPIFSLGIIIFIFFGLVISLTKIKHNIFLLLILFSIFSYFFIVIPSYPVAFHRINFTIPFFMILSSIGIVYFCELFIINYSIRFKQLVSTIGLSIILVIISSANLFDYFVSSDSPGKNYGQLPLDKINTSVVKFLSTYKEDFTKLFYVKQNSMIFLPISFALDKNQSYIEITSIDDELLKNNLSNSLIVIVMQRFNDAKKIENSINGNFVFSNEYIKVYKVID